MLLPALCLSALQWQLGPVTLAVVLLLLHWNTRQVSVLTPQAACIMLQFPGEYLLPWPVDHQPSLYSG